MGQNTGGLLRQVVTSTGLTIKRLGSSVPSSPVHLDWDFQNKRILSPKNVTHTVVFLRTKQIELYIE